MLGLMGTAPQDPWLGGDMIAFPRKPSLASQTSAVGSLVSHPLCRALDADANYDS